MRLVHSAFGKEATKTLTLSLLSQLQKSSHHQSNLNQRKELYSPQ